MANSENLIQNKDVTLYRVIILASDRSYYYHDFNKNPTRIDIQQHWENSDTHLDWEEYNIDSLNTA